jgi:hypothetical protein
MSSFTSLLFNSWERRWDWVNFLCLPVLGLLYQPRVMVSECAALGGMRIGRETCLGASLSTTNGAWTYVDRTGATVGRWCLTAWSMARLLRPLYRPMHGSHYSNAPYLRVASPIGHLQDVTTNNCNSIADLHTTNHPTLSLLSLTSLVFTG